VEERREKTTRSSRQGSLASQPGNTKAFIEKERRFKEKLK